MCSILVLVAPFYVEDSNEAQSFYAVRDWRESLPWAWELNTARYRDTDTGRFLSAEDVRELALERVRITGASTDGLANMLVGDQLNVPDWETLMRQSIKDQYIQEYQLGRGGLSQMTQEDWGSIGGMLAEQYRFLKPFAQQIADEDLSEAEIARRSRMYIHSSREAFSRATARARGWPELPLFPADGSTVCLTNCKCHWQPKRVGDGWEFTWVLDFDAEHCTSDEMGPRGPRGCIERADLWNPLVIEA